MRVDFYWNKYKYFPYERVLAKREIEALLSSSLRSIKNGLSARAINGWAKAASFCTYFSSAVGEDGSKIIPLQAKLEASANGAYPRSGAIVVIRRQSTRYSAHGLHEYRGKFNPQIVRAIGNILGLRQNNWVIDPFCGSGTVLVESAHIGWNAIGIDLNPLAILISKAKISSLHVPVETLRKESELLGERLCDRFADSCYVKAFSRVHMNRIGRSDWQNRFHSYAYLQSWFKESVLFQVSVILEEIDKLKSDEVRAIARVILSDSLRAISLQDPADLRIRRRKNPTDNSPAVPLFLRILRDRIEVILKARHYLGRCAAVQNALEGDIRYWSGCSKDSSECLPKFDGAITSPPYVTALPYIDTQRLSLVALGLISADQISHTERSLIGNREITISERFALEQGIETNSGNLPSKCAELCRLLRKAYDEDTDGFRRRNVPALTYKYLVDMGLMFTRMRSLLRKGAPFALVVGCNTTRLGERQFFIDTPFLLKQLAQQKGFVVEDSIQMDTYQRFDVHRANSIRTETLLVLKN